MNSLSRTAVETTPCDYCGAAVGEWCRTVSGARATWVHVRRQDAVWAGWRLGFREGLETAQTRLEHARENGHSIAQVEAWLDNWLRRG